MPKIVGIDLGTTNSLVAIVENGAPRVIPGPDGGETCAFRHSVQSQRPGVCG